MKRINEYDEIEYPLDEEIDLGEIEGKDPARARFIRGYLKATI